MKFTIHPEGSQRDEYTNINILNATINRKQINGQRVVVVPTHREGSFNFLFALLNAGLTLKQDKLFAFSPAAGHNPLTQTSEGVQSSISYFTDANRH